MNLNAKSDGEWAHPIDTPQEKFTKFISSQWIALRKRFVLDGRKTSQIFDMGKGLFQRDDPRMKSTLARTYTTR